MKKILFVSSEAVPYIKTGGLADVVGSLPKYFDKEKYDVRVMLPKYACMDPVFLPKLRFVCHFYVNLNWRKQYVGILETEYKGIHYYFVDNEFYFAGSAPYNNIYEDVEKFAYFSKAALASLPYIDFAPDIIHCNDWQTGLLPVFLRTSFGDDSFYAGIRTVYSIHNLQFQGRWKIREVMDITGLPEHIFNAVELESYGEANYLKGGVVYSDMVATVSPSYANEITTVEGGEGLSGLMASKRDRLVGILNGIDYEEFNPQTDPHIHANFTKKDALVGKKRNKASLQKKLNLPVNEDAMLIGMVSRLTNQKGFDLVDYAMEELLSTMDIQFVILGTGEEQYENALRYFESRYPDKIRALIGYSEGQAHRIYASCDTFLMPSLFEPCGLSQLISMRYGTLPIVRETGGLRDTVQPYNEYEHTGTGFSFSNYNAHEMMNIIRYANSIFTDHKSEWYAMIDRAMALNHSWNASARKYEELYDKICSM